MLFIPICDFYLFFYSFGWVLFTPGGDVDFPAYFFTTLCAFCFFLVGISTSLITFFTTLGGCCLFLVAIWTFLFILLNLCMHVVSS